MSAVRDVPLASMGALRFDVQDQSGKIDSELRLTGLRTTYHQPMDLNLQRARCFQAVAEELHFGRAAARLHLAQPAVSRHIKVLEAELGVTLFERTSRHVALTKSGRAFLRDITPVLANADAAVRNARRSSRGDQTLIVGFMAGTTAAAAIRETARQHPDAVFEIRQLEWTNQATALRDGTVDVALVRLPIDSTALCIQTVYTEPRGALLPADHRLAAKDSISISDIADEPVIRHRHGGIWDDYWTVTPRPDGTAPTTGASAVTIAEKLEIVASGAAITFLPESAAAAYSRHDVGWVPIDDIEPSVVAVAWPTRRKPRLVADFISHLTLQTRP